MLTELNLMFQDLIFSGLDIISKAARAFFLLEI